MEQSDNARTWTGQEQNQNDGTCQNINKAHGEVGTIASWARWSGKPK